jgi:capsular polysaccharide biosynthesis protein
VRAETLLPHAQLALAARTDVLLGVHGNGLTHLLMMPPSARATVVEIFFPDGFAHDYEWTARALGFRHYGVWNDTCVCAFGLWSAG